MPVDRIEIGGTTDEFGKTIEQFVKYCENVDKKLSVQTAKIILRKTIRESNQALKQATRVTWKKHTGDAIKSVTMRVAKSKSRPGVIYATYGWTHICAAVEHSERENQKNNNRQYSRNYQERFIEQIALKLICLVFVRSNRGHLCHYHQQLKRMR